MDPIEYLTILRKRWLLIVALGVLGGIAAFAYGSTLPTSFRSTSTVFVATQRGDTTSELVQGSTFTQAQVTSYAELVQSTLVLGAVIDDLGLNTTPQALAGSVTADIRLNSTVMDISVVSSDANLAARLANSVTTELANVVADIAPQGPDNRPAITMTTTSEARVPQAPVSPNTRLILASGLLAGLAAGVVYALSRELLDTRVRTQKDVERVTSAPILGSILKRKRKRGVNAPIIMRSAPYSPSAEGIRRVATNLEFSDVDNPVRSVVVTSAFPAEGKSTTSINVALAMAERFERVLIIDGDLRKPSIATYCQIDGAVGLTSVLVGSATLDDAIRPWANGLVDVLPSGVVPANPSQLLGSDAMATLLESLIVRYDFVVIDSPPILPVIDGLTLAKLVDGAVIVTRAESTRRAQLGAALGALEGVSARILGVVLNGVKDTGQRAYYGYQAEADAAVESDRGSGLSASSTSPVAPSASALPVLPVPHSSHGRGDDDSSVGTSAETSARSDVVDGVSDGSVDEAPRDGILETTTERQLNRSSAGSASTDGGSDDVLFADGDDLQLDDRPVDGENASTTSKRR